MAETSGAFLFVFLWALYGLPFALALTVVPALALGRLSLLLERTINEPKLGLAQYALGATAGFVVMLSLAIVTGDGATLAVAGLVAGALGVSAFRNARYRQQKASL